VTDPPRVATGAHFRLVCDFDGEGIPEQGLATVEAVWPIAGELYGMPAKGRAEPVEVHLYRDVVAYEAACDRLVEGRFKRNLAFADADTMSAHVAVQPPVSDRTLASIGLPWLTRNLLAHEAAHLVRLMAFRNFRSHPRWFTDGAAMWIKGRVQEGASGSRSDLRMPMVSTYVVRVRGLLARKELPRVSAILADDIADLDFYSQYALRWAFFRFLAEQEGGRPLRRVLARARQMGGGSGFVEALADHVAKVVPLSRIETGFTTYLGSLEPEWDEVYRSLETAGEGWVQVAFPKTNAIAWRSQPVGAEKYTIEAEIEILPGPRCQLNLLLDRQPGQGFVTVALTAGWGVTVFEYRSAPEEWRRIGAAKCEELVAGEKVAVKVAVAGGRISVAIASKPVLEVDLSPRALSGPWGLGAQSGSAGIWRHVRLSKSER
jgi:hypothetical protein